MFRCCCTTSVICWHVGFPAMLNPLSIGGPMCGKLSSLSLQQEAVSLSRSSTLLRETSPWLASIRRGSITGSGFTGEISPSKVLSRRCYASASGAIGASPMSFRSFLFLARFTKPYHRPHLSMRRSPLSSLHAPSCSPHIDERLVLDQISHLFPIPSSKSQNPVSKPLETPQPDAQPVDAFLPAQDKLRGVFLQKLKGKAAIETALSNVGADVDVSVLGKVLNNGNLSGESMVRFFNWAIKQPGVPNDVGSYRVIVKALGRRKFFVFMMGVLCDMRKRGIDGDLLMLSIVIDSFVRAGHVSRAIQIFGSLDDLGVRRDTEALNVLLSCLCHRSHVGAANSVLNSVKGKVCFDVGTYNVVAGGWSKIGKVGEVERIMREMDTDGVAPDCRTFGFLMESLGRVGRMDEAVKVFCAMKEKNCQPDTAAYNAMIFNFLSVWDFEECMKYYNRMLSDNCEPDLDTFDRIITAFLRVRKVADALQMFDEMLKRGVVPSIGTITTFIKRLCSYGPPYAALVIYKKARKSGCVISMEAYKILLMRLSEVGKCGTLLSIWKEMQECGYSSDLEVYEYIISGLCNVGQLENAVLVMEEALGKRFCPRRLVYSKLSNRLLATKKTEMAYKLFLKIKHTRSLENARKYWRGNGWHF
ncbi:putative pentatricopeptide repeat-containing protein At5g43820 isoform X2 [Vigna radiata var. radiata]|uniref:Pentatricopeptide repeat-containing protein At5g43820 isoform X2 n=1 Tax=Vigna radiata var. radiata TaxID=3916 RepID=A0A3Q0ESU2_VIGRR|nr:putative pentatricopeptide repeat-containing protein At5g43820 isoform X2 [Vigna radiata var. radiata]